MKPRFLTSHYAWIQGCYWMAYCILLSFSSVYLLDQGFSNTQIGLLLGLSGLLTALLQPFVGARADHLKVLSLGQFAALLILAMLLCTGGLLLLPGQAVQGGLFLSLLLLLQLLTSLLYALGMDCVNQGMPLNFGLARGVGAGSYALASTLCGSAAAAFGPKCIPVLLGGATLLLLAAALSFRPGTPAKQAAPTPSVPAIVSPVLLAALPPVPPPTGRGGSSLHQPQYSHEFSLSNCPISGRRQRGNGNPSHPPGPYGHPRHGALLPPAPPGCQLALGPSGRSFLFPPRPAHLAGPQCILPLWHSDL